MLDSSPIPLFDLSAWFSAAGVFAVAYPLGALACYRLNSSKPLDDALVRLTVGLALLPALVLLIGQVQGALFLRPVWFALAFGGLAAAAFPMVRSKATESAGTAKGGPESNDAEDRIPVGVVLAALPFAAWMIYLLGPLSSPPVNYDVLEYHLGVVPHFFELGRIDPIPHVFYTAQPIATEMLYTLASVFEGTARGGSTGYVQWGLILLAGLLMFRSLERAGAPRPLALLMPFGFLTHPIILRTELDRMTDLTGAVLLLGGWLLWLGRNREETEGPNRPRLFLLLGVLAGGAVGSKWTNAGTAAWGLAMAPAVGLWIGRRASPSATALQWLKGAGLFIAGGAVILIPWIAWVWIETGNPVAPFGADWFPTDRWGPENQAYLMDTHGPLALFSGDYGRRLLQRMLSPRIGTWPLFLALALALAARLRQRRSHDDRRSDALSPGPRNILLSGLIAIVVSFLLWGRLRHAADRFLTPVVAMEFLMLGAALILLIERANARWRRGAVMGLAVILFGMALVSPVPPLAGAAIYWDRALGRMTAGEFLESGLGATTDFFEAANALPEGSRVMAVGEARRFYFRHPVTLASVFDRHPIAAFIETADSPESLRSDLREAGYTHLAVNEYESARLLDFHPPPALEDDPEFMELRESKNYAGLIESYRGHSEFGAAPLFEENRALYLRFLEGLRAEAVWISAGPRGAPAFWIAPL